MAAELVYNMCVCGVVFWSYSTLGQVFQKQTNGIYVAGVHKWPSCHPTNSVTSLKRWYDSKHGTTQHWKSDTV